MQIYLTSTKGLFVSEMVTSIISIFGDRSLGFGADCRDDTIGDPYQTACGSRTSAGYSRAAAAREKAQKQLYGPQCYNIIVYMYRAHSSSFDTAIAASRRRRRRQSCAPAPSASALAGPHPTPATAAASCHPRGFFPSQQPTRPSPHPSQGWLLVPRCPGDSAGTAGSESAEAPRSAADEGCAAAVLCLPSAVPPLSSKRSTHGFPSCARVASHSGAAGFEAARAPRGAAGRR
eukprot:SAG31_NODE_7451_length_1686_cov_1.572149_1_plen_233_part_00